jgi:acetyl-CoA carboxylase carboxyl transferase subunit beta
MAWSRFRKKRDMPEGLWVKCKSCHATLFAKELTQNFQVCKVCAYHFRQPARERLAMLLDPGSFVEMWEDLYTMDRLSFVDKEPYPEKIRNTAKKVGLVEGAIAGAGALGGRPVSICVLDFDFMGGSMGTVVGEKVTRALELAHGERMPCVVVSCSGGARMHEGTLSLMQMGKTSAAASRLNEAGGLYISVLANPTTGGVMASFAALGDVIFAEPGALVGFAGPRVIQETLRTQLPEGFQTAEFLLEKGFVDRIVERPQMREAIGQAIDFLWTYTDDQLQKYRVDVPEGAQQDVEGGDGVAGGASADEPEAAHATDPRAD